MNLVYKNNLIKQLEKDLFGQITLITIWYYSLDKNHSKPMVLTQRVFNDFPIKKATRPGGFLIL